MRVDVVDIVVGARPNFVKAAPLLRALSAHPELQPRLVHTGQHYDARMSQVFFEELALPEPDAYLEVGSGHHGAQTAAVLERYEALLLDAPAQLVVAIGDVNSTVAVALAAAKLHMPVAHLESGLRSFDRRMPEEINRVLTDQLSQLLLCTEPAAVENLVAEGISGDGVQLVGNIMLDAIAGVRSDFEARRPVPDLEDQPYGVVTLHRPQNVDGRDTLETAIDTLRAAADRVPLVFPMHPRTRASLERHGLEDAVSDIAALRIVEPLGYLDFMALVSHATVVMTDSGGLQSETTWLGVPCITLRPVTEHRITVEAGTNQLCEIAPTAVSSALDVALDFDRSSYTPPPLWDGQAAPRCAAAIAAFCAHGKFG